MRKIYTLLFCGLATLMMSMQAQEIDDSFVFVDADGNILPNGAIVIRNEVEPYGESEVINSGLAVKNRVGSNDYIKVNYEIERIDNGSYQICFPMSCNYQFEVGVYETTIGQLMGEMQDIMSEWFPEGDGECIVHLSLELFVKQSGFPPSYDHKADGPSVTLRFVKGDIGPEPIPGDVNGDSEVNIADVNAIIDMILSQNTTPSGDVNGDGEVNIADVNSVLSIILN